MEPVSRITLFITFDMVDGNIVLQVQHLPGHNHQGLHHGKTGEDSPRYEVGWEDGGMPARNHGSGEVKGYDGVYRKYQWRCQAGQDQGKTFPTLPVFGRSRPAEGHESYRSFYGASPWLGHVP